MRYPDVRGKLDRGYQPLSMNVWGKVIPNPDVDRLDAPRPYTLHAVTGNGATLEVGNLSLGLAAAAVRVFKRDPEVWRVWVMDHAFGERVTVA